MASNKSARQELEMIYGKGCMFRKARIAERIEKMGGIRTYKSFVETRRYKSKKLYKLLETMTYHHLRHLENDGRTDVANGAIVNELAHQYLHSLPREQEEIINNMLREYKKEFELRGGLLVPSESSIDIIQPFTTDLTLEETEDYLIIPLVNNTREDDEKRKFNRAQEKRNTQKLIDEALYGDEER